MTSQINRENKLILLLSKQKDYMTSEKLAYLLDTSTKTVYRLIKKMKSINLLLFYRQQNDKIE